VSAKRVASHGILDDMADRNTAPENYRMLRDGQLLE
jgi:hypothetical protein